MSAQSVWAAACDTDKPPGINMLVRHGRACTPPHLLPSKGQMKPSLLTPHRVVCVMCGSNDLHLAGSASPPPPPPPPPPLQQQQPFFSLIGPEIPPKMDGSIVLDWFAIYPAIPSLHPAFRITVLRLMAGNYWGLFLFCCTWRWHSAPFFLLGK